MEEFEKVRELRAMTQGKKEGDEEKTPDETVTEKLKVTPLSDLEKIMHSKELERGRERQRKQEKPN